MQRLRGTAVEGVPMWGEAVSLLIFIVGTWVAVAAALYIAVRVEDSTWMRDD
jgi:hypothetical protein